MNEIKDNISSVYVEAVN